MKRKDGTEKKSKSRSKRNRLRLDFNLRTNHRAGHVMIYAFEHYERENQLHRSFKESKSVHPIQCPKFTTTFSPLAPLPLSFQLTFT